MPGYLLRRLGYGVLILIGVNLLTFFLFFTVNTPDDMARLNIGGKRVTQEQIDKWKSERGYDRPLYWNAQADPQHGHDRGRAEHERPPHRRVPLVLAGDAVGGVDAVVAPHQASTSPRALARSRRLKLRQP